MQNHLQKAFELISSIFFKNLEVNLIVYKLQHSCKAIDRQWGAFYFTAQIFLMLQPYRVPQIYLYQ